MFLSWAIRLALIAVFGVAFNYWLHASSAPAHASHPNRYAVANETSSGQNYSGIQGDIYVGDPSPCCPTGGFSNETIWAVLQGSSCSGKSWVETGWYEGYKAGNFGRYYKFIYKVPGTNNCTYTEANIGGTPVVGSAPNYRLERYTGTQWRWYWLGSHVASVTAGWSYGNVMQGGGEVGGHSDNIGMLGAIYNLKYRVGTGSWTTWTENTTDSYICSTNL